ncbi:hypothetical protein [Synechococcus sp. BMK-MC-1]|uniref:hypothetical protein n=1 Tax=Synechococcus sp. BMK-MC-1 TaxID=1442551 RepID=UPI0016482766|nr:hypothetical protein [Synechococcus sp. BMK-MC-1]QNI67063.1 hypothetical protein SynBMKMC1_00979 [Synechococcus sp. BMK-MC-1]
MTQRTATGLVLVLLVGLITHCASRVQKRVRYRVLPQQAPGRLLPVPVRHPSSKPGLLL